MRRSPFVARGGGGDEELRGNGGDDELRGGRRGRDQGRRRLGRVSRRGRLGQQARLLSEARYGRSPCVAPTALCLLHDRDSVGTARDERRRSRNRRAVGAPRSRPPPPPAGLLKQLGDAKLWSASGSVNGAGSLTPPSQLGYSGLGTFASSLPSSPSDHSSSRSCSGLIGLAPGWARADRPSGRGAGSQPPRPAPEPPRCFAQRPRSTPTRDRESRGSRRALEKAPAHSRLPACPPPRPLAVAPAGLRRRFRSAAGDWQLGCPISRAVFVSNAKREDTRADQGGSRWPNTCSPFTRSKARPGSR